MEEIVYGSNPIQQESGDPTQEESDNPTQRKDNNPPKEDPSSDDGPTQVKNESNQGNVASEHAGVLSGVCLNQSERAQCLAGVFSGEDNWLGERMMHTRCPWLEEFQVSQTGYKDKDMGTPLFDCSELSNVELPQEEEVKGYRTQYLIDVFFQKRFFRAMKKKEPFGRSSPKALSMAWDKFIATMGSATNEWFDTLNNFKDSYMRTLEGTKMAIHERSIQERVNCCVSRQQMCPMCYHDSPKATAATREGLNNIISFDLRIMVSQLDSKWGQYKCKRQRALQHMEMMQSEAQVPPAQIDPDAFRQELRIMGIQVYDNGRSITELSAKLELWENKTSDNRDSILELKEELKELRDMVRSIKK